MTRAPSLRATLTAGALTFATLSASGSRVSAQVVGALPERSPFADVTGGHRVGIVAGYMATGRDPAGVGPKGGPMLGVRYDLHAGGPAYLSARFFGFSSERDILDYTKKAAQRRVGTQSGAIGGTELGLTLAATGDRSWRRLQPLVHAGVGLVFGIGDRNDVSGYRFPTAFSFSWGLGARYVTGRNSQLRADVSWLHWGIKYPESYRSTEGDTVAIRPSGTLSPGTWNRALTVSWTWGIFR